MITLWWQSKYEPQSYPKVTLLPGDPGKAFSEEIPSHWGPNGSPQTSWAQHPFTRLDVTKDPEEVLFVLSILTLLELKNGNSWKPQPTKAHIHYPPEQRHHHVPRHLWEKPTVYPRESVWRKAYNTALLWKQCWPCRPSERMLRTPRASQITLWELWGMCVCVCVCVCVRGPSLYEVTFYLELSFKPPCLPALVPNLYLQWPN